MATTQDPAPVSIRLRADAVSRAVVDVSEGLDRVMGDRALYIRVLARFRSDYAAGAAPLRRALAAGERTLAHRLVHTAKGASGMIGAHLLYRHASALDEAIRTGSEAEGAALERFEAALARVLDVLDSLLAGNVIANPADPHNGPLPADADLLARLRALLGAGDGAAVDLLDAAQTRLAEILEPALLADLTDAVYLFDFERALAALARANQA